MKKQQDASLAGKKLSRSEMKNLQGGVKKSTYGYWYCLPDYDSYCYSSLAHCESECAAPFSCWQHRTGACV